MGRFVVDSSGSGYGPVAMFQEGDNVILVSNNAVNFAYIYIYIYIYIYRLKLRIFL